MIPPNISSKQPSITPLETPVPVPSPSLNVTYPFPMDQEKLRQLQRVFLDNLPPDYSAEDLQERVFDATVLACQNREWSKINRARDALIGIRNSFGETLFTTILETQTKEIVEVILQQDLHQILAYGEFKMALHRAIRLNRADLIPLLLEYILKDQRDSEDKTPLILAVQEGKPHIVKLLLNEGVSIRSTFKYSETSSLENPQKKISINLTPAMWAVARGEIGCLDILLSHPDHQWNQQAKRIGSLLHIAIYFGQYSTLSHLLTHYYDRVSSLIETPNHRGHTPLMLAAMLGDLRALYLLHQKGANPNSADSKERVPLHWAALNNQRSCIKMLIYLGADLNSRDKDLKTPLDLASKDDTRALIANSLGKTKVELRKPPEFSRTPPQNLVFKGGGPKGIAYLGALQALESAGALVEVVRYAGTSAGAITAVLLAVGYTSQETESILRETSLMSFIDHPLKKEKIIDAVRGQLNIRGLWNTFNTVKGLVLKAKTNPIGLGLDLARKALKTLWNCTGICEGETFRIWIEDCIQKKTGIEYCTFGELRKLIQQGKNFKHLHLFGTKIGNNPEIVHFHSEVFGDQSNDCDNLVISDAVRISMSIPGVFKPHTPHFKDVDGRRKECVDRGSFVDGGLLNNLPVETFDYRKYCMNGVIGDEGQQPVFNRRTLGFSLYSPDKEVKDDEAIENIFQLLKGIAGVFTEAETLIRNLNSYNQHRIVEIDNRGVGLLSFNLSPERQQDLIDSGRTAVTTFLNSNAETSSVPLVTSLVRDTEYEDALKDEKAGKVESAFQAFKSAAEKGHPLAQISLGNCYFEGKGTRQNLSQAVTWYLKAREQGCEEANYRLGIFYHRTRRYVQALNYLQQARQNSHAASIQFLNSQFYTNPFIATVCGNLDYIRQYIQRNGTAFLQQQCQETHAEDHDDQGLCVLHLAAKKNQLAVVQFLIENHFAQANIPDAHHYLAAHWAAKFGHFQVLESFLDAGVPVNARGAYDRTLLHMAVFNSQYKVAKFLLSRGADINLKAPSDQDKTVLYDAVLHLDEPMVKLLISNALLNVNLIASPHNRPAASAFSVLDYACEQGHLNILRMLITHRSWQELPRADKLKQLEKLLQIKPRYQKALVADYLKQVRTEILKTPEEAKSEENCQIV